MLFSGTVGTGPMDKLGCLIFVYYFTHAHHAYCMLIRPFAMMLPYHNFRGLWIGDCYALIPCFYDPSVAL